jgi:CelD/BcsL family acetyltransferase involved in cellulose biosynthesis
LTSGKTGPPFQFELNLSQSPAATDVALNIHVHRGDDAVSVREHWTKLRAECGAISPSLRHQWLAILREGLGHTPYCLEACRGNATVGLLPLAYVRSIFFGRFLVGLPYLNVGGVLTQDEAVAAELIERAARLADELEVQYLELRHETRWEHSAINHEMTEKVHMRLELPTKSEELWKAFKPKLRSQIR